MVGTLEQRKKMLLPSVMFCVFSAFILVMLTCSVPTGWKHWLQHLSLRIEKREKDNV